MDSPIRKTPFTGRNFLLTIITLPLAALLWLPCMHLLLRPTAGELDRPPGPMANGMLEYHLNLWTDPASREKEVAAIRRSNAEWDFMARSYFVWAMGNAALRDPALAPRVLPIMDLIIDQTVDLEKKEGIYVFLMPYARSSPWIMHPPRSLFLDGEIALMMGLRRMVQEKPQYRTAMKERIEHILDRMGRGRVLCAESYPDECWMFCNTVSLAAVRVGDYLDGTNHQPFLTRWVQMAREKLVDKKTGLLISSFGVDGRSKDGPEGSSIWMAIHCLDLIDRDFARDQYARAKSELFRTTAGFGHAREWPLSWPGPQDIDSGHVLPGVDLSASSSGLAMIAAATCGDRETLGSLLTTLNLGGFGSTTNGRLKFHASNTVGDAVVLYALTLGPAWEKIRQGGRP
ncbi:MAG: hypothetical protein ABFD92_10700 [Planctomycetaceae bacterium]|nr:hypothetical protein [Planctomycetaceae bacterium]